MTSRRAAVADLTLTQDLRGYAIEQGMDLVGVAPIERLADATFAIPETLDMLTPIDGGQQQAA